MGRPVTLVLPAGNVRVEAQEAELKALAVLPDDQINTGDIPEQKDWSGARRGLFLEFKDFTLAVARGDRQVDPDEPKVWKETPT
jgi:hypothetical protein